MKQTKQCPKCQSKEIYTNAGDRKAGDRIRMPIDNWTGFMIDMYFCIQCGYIEEYIEEKSLNQEKTINKIKVHFKAL